MPSVGDERFTGETSAEVLGLLEQADDVVTRARFAATMMKRYVLWSGSSGIEQ